MLQINKYVEVIDSEKIISIGKYRIGIEIPCGEYYLWGGQDIWYSYKRKKEKEYHEYTREVYYTIGDAAQAIGISSTSISKVLRGQRNTAGGFIWKKFSVEEAIPETIDITFDLGLTNAGEVRRIAKIDDEGNILQEYASVMEASKRNNIEYKTIQRQINNAQGWKYL